MSVVLEQEREELMELGAAGPSQSRLVWRQLLRNPLAAASLVVLGIIVLMAILYPLV